MQPSPLNILRGVDHFAVTVPDIEEAHEFLVGLLGAQLEYAMTGGEGEENWDARQRGLPPGVDIKEVRMYLLGHGPKIQVFEFKGGERRQEMPKNCDVGGIHIALYVNDIEGAVEHLKHNGVEVIGEPLSGTGPIEGQRWVYFMSPWGQMFELVSFPDGRAFEYGKAYTHGRR